MRTDIFVSEGAGIDPRPLHKGLIVNTVSLGKGFFFF